MRLLFVILVVASGCAPVVRPAAAVEPPWASLTISDLRCTDEIAPLRTPNGSSISWTQDGHGLVVSVDGNGFGRGLVKREPDPLRRRVLIEDAVSGATLDIVAGRHPQLSWGGGLLAFEAPDVPASDSVVTILDVASGARLDQIQPDPASGRRWVGETLLYVRDGAIRRWSVGGDALMRQITHASADMSVGFSSDGRLAVIVANWRSHMPDQDYRIVDLVTGAETPLPDAWSVEMSPEGHRVLVGYEGRRELREEDGSVRSFQRPFFNVLWPHGADPLFEPAFEGQARMPARGVRLRTFDDRDSGVVVPYPAWSDSFSPGNDRLAVRYNDGWGTVDTRVYQCVADDSPGPAQSDTVTLYYAESFAEPWSAGRDGGAVADWSTWVRHDLDVAGLHPRAIERVRSAPEAAVYRCAEVTCSNGFALAVTFPRSDYEHALHRCFVYGDPPSYVPYYPAVQAETQTRCRPLYRAETPSPVLE